MKTSIHAYIDYAKQLRSKFSNFDYYPHSSITFKIQCLNSSNRQHMVFSNGRIYNDKLPFLNTYAYEPVEAIYQRHLLACQDHIYPYPVDDISVYILSEGGEEVRLETPVGEVYDGYEIRVTLNNKTEKYTIRQYDLTDEEQLTIPQGVMCVQIRDSHNNTVVTTYPEKGHVINDLLMHYATITYLKDKMSKNGYVYDGIHFGDIVFTKGAYERIHHSNLEVWEVKTSATRLAEETISARDTYREFVSQVDTDKVNIYQYIHPIGLYISKKDQVPTTIDIKVVDVLDSSIPNLIIRKGGDKYSIKLYRDEAVRYDLIKKEEVLKFINHTYEFWEDIKQKCDKITRTLTPKQFYHYRLIPQEATFIGLFKTSSYVELSYEFQGFIVTDRYTLEDFVERYTLMFE